MGTVMDEKHTRFEPKSLADVSQAPGQTAVTPVKFTLHPPARKEENVIYVGTPHGKAELAYLYFYFYFLLVLNLIYFAAEYVELYTSMYSGFFVTALQMCGATDG